MLHPTYNYTLELQGISTNVTCAYTSDSPVNVTIPLTNVWQTNGTCPPGQDLFLDNTTFISIPSNNYLGLWACLTEPSADSYNLYFRGVGTYYTPEIGNITCTVSPFRPTVFPLTYTGQAGIFTAQAPIASSPSSSPELGLPLVKSLGSVVWEAQSLNSNLVAESIITAGVKSFNLPPDMPTIEYLRLYEKMIEGIFDYEVRSIYYLSSSLMHLVRRHTFAYCTLQKSMSRRRHRACALSTAPQI